MYGAAGGATAALVARRSLAHGRYSGTYGLGWRLASLAHYVIAPKYLPESYEAAMYHWWKGDQPAPDVRP